MNRNGGRSELSTKAGILLGIGLGAVHLIQGRIQRQAAADQTKEQCAAALAVAKAITERPKEHIEAPRKGWLSTGDGIALAGFSLALVLGLSQSLLGWFQHLTAVTQAEERHAAAVATEMAIAERQVDQEALKLALGILSEKPPTEEGFPLTQRPIRKWASARLNKDYSLKLNAEELELLITGVVSLPEVLNVGERVYRELERRALTTDNPVFKRKAEEQMKEMRAKGLGPSPTSSN